MTDVEKTYRVLGSSSPVLLADGMVTCAPGNPFLHKLFACGARGAVCESEFRGGGT